MDSSDTSTTVTDRRQQALVLFALAAGFLAVISRLNTADHDMLHGMSLFREARNLGHVPREDVFAYTPTVNPSVHHEWLMGGILYYATVASGLGATGLMLVKYFLTSVVLVGSFLIARSRGVSVPVFATFAAIVIPFGWIGFPTVRAGLFTLAFLTCLLGLLELDRRGHRWWVILWLGMNVVWLNVHGGFVAGLGLFGLYTIERFVRTWRERRAIVPALKDVTHLILAGVTLIPLMTLNPYGWEYIEYLWHALRMKRPLIREWAPLWETYQPLVTMECFIVSVGLVAYAAATRGLKQLPQLALVTITAYLALKHIRHGAIYAIVWLCYAPAFIEQTGLGVKIRAFWQHRETFIRRAAIGCAALGLFVAVQNRFWELQIPTSPAQSAFVFPAGACDYLAEHEFDGNLMVPFSAGSFVSWKLYPAVKVSFDGRYEAAYPPGAIEENFDFYDAKPGWDETLTRYETDAVLVPRESELETAFAKLTAAAPQAPWRQVYADDGFLIYQKVGSAESLPTVDRTNETLTAQLF